MTETKNLFSIWLVKNLEKRNMIANDITKQAGLSSAQVSRIISGERSPGIEALISIAKALHLPRIEVFHAAGLLDDEGISDFEITKLAHKISMLPLDQQVFVDCLIETLMKKLEGQHEEP
jgi:transcriptional regulator with XRE-family HTH domain